MVFLTLLGAFPRCYGKVLCLYINNRHSPETHRKAVRSLSEGCRRAARSWLEPEPKRRCKRRSDWSEFGMKLVRGSPEARQRPVGRLSEGHRKAVRSWAETTCELYNDWLTSFMTFIVYIWRKLEYISCGFRMFRGVRVDENVSWFDY